MVRCGRGVRAGSSKLVVAAMLMSVGGGACDDGTVPDATGEAVTSADRALTTEDGLADAYAFFKELFVSIGMSQQYPVGFGFHPGLVTETITVPTQARLEISWSGSGS